MSDHRRLRKDTIQFLDVKEDTSLPVRVLPQGIDVLKLMLGRKSREKELNKELPVMCPFISKTFQPKCSTKDGCKVKSDPTEWSRENESIDCYASSYVCKMPVRILASTHSRIVQVVETATVVHTALICLQMPVMKSRTGVYQ